MEFLTEPVVLLAIILAAVAAGVVVWLMMRRPPTAPGVAVDDFSYKGSLVVSYKGNPSDPPGEDDYKKKPKDKIKVWYKEVGGSQWGSVTFFNNTNEEVIFDFPNASPFQASGPQAIPLAPNTNQEFELTNDPGEGKEDDYTFHVKIKKADGTYFDFDPGVRVRRG